MQQKADILITKPLHGYHPVLKYGWFLLVWVTVIGCEKGEANYTSRITLWNAVPNSQGFFLKAGPTEVAGNLLFNQPLYSTAANSGTYPVSWGITGAIDPDSTFMTDLASGADYTLLFYDSLHRYKVYLARDRLPESSEAGKANLRFFPMVINANDLNIENDTGRVIMSSSVFADFAQTLTGVEFKSVDSMSGKLRLVQGSGASRLVLDSLEQVTMEVGRSYSLYATGVLGNSGSSRPRLFLHKEE